MPWQIPAIISLITVSFANVLERHLMRHDKSDPIGYAIVFQFILAIFAFIFAILFGRWIPPNIQKMPINWLLSGVLWAGATLFGFKAIKSLSAGETNTLTSSASVISMLLGFALFKENLKPIVIFGAVLIFISIFVIYSRKLNFISRKGIIFALLAACCSGVAVVNDAYILKTYEAFSYTAISSLLPGILLLILFLPNFLKLIKTMNIKFIAIMIVFCILYVAQAIAYYFAFEKGAPVSQLSPLIRSSVVLTVILGAIFLKERDNLLRKVIASIIMLIGVLLLG